MLVEPYSSGEIINFDYSEKLIIIKVDNSSDIITKKKFKEKKMRGINQKQPLMFKKKTETLQIMILMIL